MTFGPFSTICVGCGWKVSSPPILHGRDRLTGVPGSFGVVRCMRCGLAWTSPRPSAESLTAYYPRAYFARWDDRRQEQSIPGLARTGAVRSIDGRRRPLALAQQLRHRLDRVRLERIVRGPYRVIAERSPGQLLDVGCGSGDLAAVFAERGWRVFGIEPSASACQLAARRGVEVHCGTMESAPWPDGSFDAVLFTDSLEHMPNPLATLERASRLMRQDGMLAVTVPNFGGWQRRVFRSYWFHLDLPRHLQHFDSKSLAAALRRASFEPTEIKTSSMVLGFPASVQYLVFDRCVVTRGLRAIQVACLPVHAIVRIVDMFGGGDRLHVTARRRGQA